MVDSGRYVLGNYMTVGPLGVHHQVGGVLSLAPTANMLTSCSRTSNCIHGRCPLSNPSDQIIISPSSSFMYSVDKIRINIKTSSAPSVPVSNGVLEHEEKEGRS